MDKQQAGWWWPDESRKAHWFPFAEYRSGCGRWLYRGIDMADDGEFRDADCCAACKRARDKAMKRAATTAQANRYK